MRRTFAVLTCVAALAACDSASEPLAPRSSSPLLTGTPSGLIAGRYIVTLSDGADPRAVALEHGIQPTHVYGTVLNGFAGAISDVALQALRLDGRVTRVEQDATVFASTTQTGATWGLDRIDQRTLPLSTTYTYTPTGDGVTAYILDTGIRYDHAEFGGRATFGTDMMADSATQQGADCQGHGTHVAGTVGGTTYGVAKDVDLVAVRVLGCDGSGTISGIIGGMNWVAANADLPAVANLSIGSLLPQRSATLDQATSNLIAAGVTVVLAAGNGIPNGGVGIDACSGAPGGHPLAITVGATDKTDTKTIWSNYGSCVTLFAPGSSIVSAAHGSSTGSTTMSGTSMAAPHTAGVAALYLEQDTAATPATVKAALLSASTKGVVKNSLSTNNHLLYSGVAP